MKIRFEDLAAELPLSGNVSTTYKMDEATGMSKTTRAQMSMKGSVQIDDEHPLTGLVKWMSDDDMEMDSFDVSSFLRYEYNVYGEGDTQTSTLILTNDPVPEPAPEPVPPTAEELLAQAKAGKSSAITRARDDIIAAGVDVTTSYGVEHFTLNEKDKTLLLGIYAMVQSGVTSYPYHSINLSSRSTNICTVYSSEDIAKIATAAFGFITYHESYANVLLNWLERETDPEVAKTIVYGAELPSDLQSYLDMLLTTAGIDPALFDTSNEESTSTSTGTEAFNGSSTTDTSATETPAASESTESETTPAT